MYSFLTFVCGRTGRIRNALSPCGDRGFESPSLSATNAKTPLRDFFDLRPDKVRADPFFYSM